MPNFEAITIWSVSYTHLTYPDPISVDQETLVFRRGVFPPPLSLLIPTFAFPDAPEYLAVRLRR